MICNGWPRERTNFKKMWFWSQQCISHATTYHWGHLYTTIHVNECQHWSAVFPYTSCLATDTNKKFYSQNGNQQSEKFWIICEDSLGERNDCVVWISHCILLYYTYSVHFFRPSKRVLFLKFIWTLYLCSRHIGRCLHLLLGASKTLRVAWVTK